MTGQCWCAMVSSEGRRDRRRATGLLQIVDLSARAWRGERGRECQGGPGVAHAHTHTHTHARTHTLAHTRTHTHRHGRRHTQTQTHAHARTHRQQWRGWGCRANVLAPSCCVHNMVHTPTHSVCSAFSSFSFSSSPSSPWPPPWCSEVKTR